MCYRKCGALSVFYWVSAPASLRPWLRVGVSYQQAHAATTNYGTPLTKQKRIVQARPRPSSLSIALLVHAFLWHRGVPHVAFYTITLSALAYTHTRVSYIDISKSRVAHISCPFPFFHIYSMSLHPGRSTASLFFLLFPCSSQFHLALSICLSLLRTHAPYTTHHYTQTPRPSLAHCPAYSQSTPHLSPTNSSVLDLLPPSCFLCTISRWRFRPCMPPSFSWPPFLTSLLSPSPKRHRVPWVANTCISLSCSYPPVTLPMRHPAMVCHSRVSSQPPSLLLSRALYAVSQCGGEEPASFFSLASRLLALSAMFASSPRADPPIPPPSHPPSRSRRQSSFLPSNTTLNFTRIMYVPPFAVG